jgi:hypothetical protein
LRRGVRIHIDIHRHRYTYTHIHTHLQRRPLWSWMRQRTALQWPWSVIQELSLWGLPASSPSVRRLTESSSMIRHLCGCHSAASTHQQIMVHAVIIMIFARILVTKCAVLPRFYPTNGPKYGVVGIFIFCFTGFSKVSDGKSTGA